MTWLVLLLLLTASAAISGSETTLFSLNRSTLAEFAKSPSALKRCAALLMEQPRRTLLTILLANVVVNTAIFTVAYMALEFLDRWHSGLQAVGGILAPVGVIACGDMLPKSVALANPLRWAPLAAAVVSALRFALSPIVLVLGVLVDALLRLLAPAPSTAYTLTRDELQSLLQLSARDGIIDSRENEMLLGAVALAQTSVREVMTPRVDIRSIAATADSTTARLMAQTSRRRTLLVHGTDLDDIRGLVHSRDLFLNPHARLLALVRPVHYVPEQVNLVQLVRHFRQKRIESAVVVDEYGGTAGVVSAVDVAKRIVGDLPEGGISRLVAVEALDDNTYRLPGDLSVRLWATRFGVGEIDGHIDTVAGLILSRLGRMPRPGDRVHFGNLMLTVESMDRRRIATVLLQRQSQEIDSGVKLS